MNNKILFMIINDEVKYLADSDMDHRQWYTSLGLDINNYDNIIRGYVIDGKIIFFKGMFNYDNEVIEFAKRFAPGMKLTLNNPHLEVYCGILAHSLGGKWEPILKINESELTGNVKKVEEKKKEYTPKDLESSLEFKNDYNDPKFIKLAVIITIVVLIISIIAKVSLIAKGRFKIGGFDLLLTLIQVILLGVTILGYTKKANYTKYTSIASSIALLLTFDIIDILIGILYFLFSIDATYFTKILSKIKKK